MFRGPETKLVGIGPADALAGKPDGKRARSLPGDTGPEDRARDLPDRHPRPEEADGATETVGVACRRLLRHPFDTLVLRWNWKAALLSALFRGILFFATNISAGLPAAVAAMSKEFIYRVLTSGFYGAFTQAFRKARPAWLASLTLIGFLPLFQHLLEFMVHWLGGTPKLLVSIGASVGFTAVSTLFNLHAMRQGALVVGREGKSLGADFRQMPLIVYSFIAWLPRQVVLFLRRRGRPGKTVSIDQHKT